MRNLTIIGWFYTLLYGAMAIVTAIYSAVAAATAQTAPEALAAAVWVLVAYGIGLCAWAFVTDRHFGLLR